SSRLFSIKTAVLRYEMALMTTMPAKTNPNPARTRRSIDQWKNHSISPRGLGVGAGLLSGTGSDRTGAGVAERSCVTDSMVQTCAGVGAVCRCRINCTLLRKTLQEIF